MRINRNQKPETGNQRFILVALVLTLCMVGIGYAEPELEELKKSLKEQEEKIIEGQAGPGNKGYIYSRGDVEISAVEPVSPVYIAPDVQVQVKELYGEAGQLYREGRFEEAKRLLEEIIELNPLHIPARSLLKRIADRQTELSFRDGVILTKERMLDVDKAWLPPERLKEEERPLALEIKKPVKTERLRYMEAKASQVIPEINFTDAHLRDVLKYLSEISGINIVIDEDLFHKEGGEPEVPEEVEVPPAGVAEVKTPAFPSPISARITISLTNIPLIDALKYILSAKGLKYRIDEYAVVVSTPERLAAVETETRYYHLTAGVGIFTEFTKRVREEEAEVRGIAKGLEAKARITIKDVLEESGVPFPPGSKVFLDKRTGTLIVRNTPENLAIVEDVLRMLDITPFQVEIEARFVELTRKTAEELGLEWMITSLDYRFGSDKQFRWDNDTTDVIFGQYPDPLNNTGREGVTHGLRYLEDISGTPLGNILSISGVLTKPQFRMILHALNQSGCANVLSAPKVTTLNNQQAQIEVVQEIIYPTEFELTPATTNDSGTVVTQPVVTPTAWTTRDVGIVLNVTPSVGADRKTVNLTLLPEVSEIADWFIGWYNYGIEADEVADRWSALPIYQPRIFTKNVATNVVIHDGETVVIGGLIKEELIATEDKIPLLGDIPIIGGLFRSQTEQSQKTNLLIFVTANLLTPAGERIRR